MDQQISLLILSETFLNSELHLGASVTVNSVAVATTALEAENYIVDGVTNGNNEVDKITSIVVGPKKESWSTAQQQITLSVL